MISDDLRDKLLTWAASKPTVNALFIFGSYANGTAGPESDLDIAFDFVDQVDSPLAELITNAAIWKTELTDLTGITVKDLYLFDDQVVRSGPCFQIFPQ